MIGRAGILTSRMIAALLVIVPCACGGGDKAVQGDDRGYSDKDLRSAVEGERRIRDDFFGVILPSQTSVVTARLDSHILEVKVKISDRVKKGQVLAILDDAPVRELLRGAKADRSAAASDLRRAKDALAEAKRLYFSQKKLFDEVGGISRNELDKAGGDVNRARAERNRAAAALQKASSTMRGFAQQDSYTKIRAPFDGQVAQVYKSAASVVRLNEPIVRLITTSDLELSFAVPPERRNSLRVGGKLAVTIPTSGEVIESQISRIAPDINGNAQMIFVEGTIAIENLEKVQSGQKVRVDLVTEKAEATPSEADDTTDGPAAADQIEPAGKG